MIKNIVNIQKINPLLMTLETLAEKSESRSGGGHKIWGDKDDEPSIQIVAVCSEMRCDRTALQVNSTNLQ